MERIKALWTEATPLLRALFVTAVCVLIGTSAMFTFGPDQVDLAPLYTQLDPGDAQAMTEELDARDIPYELRDGGTRIDVPRAEIGRIRMELASAGLPRGGGVGFELFDQGNLMMTDFAQRVNYRRAMQGELARTIAQMPEVDSARVHLALPDNSVFTRDRTEPSASVYIKLRPGRVLTPRQAQGVVHLVSSSVENLPSERVAVLDGNGRLIGPAPGRDGIGAGNRALGLAREVEKQLEGRIIDLVEPLVGPGRAVARVTAELDLSRVEETQENYDPDNSTLRSERTLEENTNQTRNTGGGLAGTAGNLPTRPDGSNIAGPGSNATAARTTTESEFAIPRTIRKVERPMGQVQRLSVAVLLDTAPPSDPLDPEQENATEDGEEEVSTPKRTLPSQEAIAKIIEKAIGFDAERGDELEVMFAPFTRPDDVTVGTMATASVASLPTWIPLAGLLFLAALAIGFTVFASERRRQRRVEAAAAATRAAAARAEMSEEQIQAEKRPKHLKDQVRELADNNVQATVDVLKTWLAPTQENHGNG
ncbi:MAG: flagellar basal-body MS-ring/collar protein FliF [Myxococcota bacterium]